LIIYEPEDYRTLSKLRAKIQEGPARGATIGKRPALSAEEMWRNAGDVLRNAKLKEDLSGMQELNNTIPI
jgi:hypothetical protein